MSELSQLYIQTRDQDTFGALSHLNDCDAEKEVRRIADESERDGFMSNAQNAWGKFGSFCKCEKHK